MSPEQVWLLTEMHNLDSDDHEAFAALKQTWLMTPSTSDLFQAALVVLEIHARAARWCGSDAIAPDDAARQCISRTPAATVRTMSPREAERWAVDHLGITALEGRIKIDGAQLLEVTNMPTVQAQEQLDGVFASVVTRLCASVDSGVSTAVDAMDERIGTLLELSLAADVSVRPPTAKEALVVLGGMDKWGNRNHDLSVSQFSDESVAATLGSLAKTLAAHGNIGGALGACADWLGIVSNEIGRAQALEVYFDLWERYGCDMRDVNLSRILHSHWGPAMMTGSEDDVIKRFVKVLVRCGALPLLETVDLSAQPHLKGNVLESLFGDGAAEVWPRSLRKLSLMHCKRVNGVIPASIQGSVMLETLEIWRCRISGSIPREIDSLSRLTRLDLHNNRLTGPIPIELWNLPLLTHLCLENNQFSGGLPKETGNLLSLQVLKLGGNVLDGHIPVEIGRLPSLTDLSFASRRLAGNQFSGNIPRDIGDLSQLTSLNLGANNLLGGAIPTEICNLTQLTFLGLHFSSFTGRLPVELFKLSQLRRMWLDGNSFSGSLPKEFGALSNLCELQLNSNQFTGPLPVELGNLTSLTNLELQGNSFTGPLPLELGKLAQLSHLHLQHNSFSGTLPPELAKLSQLVTLDLQHNRFSGAIPVDLCSLAHLSVLSLNNNRFTGAVPHAVADLANLAHLDLEENELGGELPLSVIRMKVAGLSVTLDHNAGFTLPLNIGELGDSVVRLNLRACSLMGALPASLGDLPSLKQLDISGNTKYAVDENGNFDYDRPIPGSGLFDPYFWEEGRITRKSLKRKLARANCRVEGL